jgi:hypothetical protein
MRVADEIDCHVLIRGLTMRAPSSLPADGRSRFFGTVQEQEKLGVFTPWISFKESRGPTYFHWQLLMDFVTVEEIANRLVTEF